MPAPRPVRRLAVAGAALVAIALLLAVRSPTPATAAVTPLYGYRATVDGFTSWYGSYGMAGLGTGWCIDHGSRAPDPAFAYRPADLSAVPLRTRTAMAWVLGRHASGTDRVRHAAVMLVLHDLMGARYPSGPLDVDRLPVARLAGFAGREAAVLDEARRLKADGRRHAHLRGPLRLGVRLGSPGAERVSITVTALDAGGRPVAGLPVSLDATTGTPLGVASGTTDADGRLVTFARPVRLPLTVRANALVPRLDLDAWAPTTRAAQRVARPAVEAARASATIAAPAPPSTTTTTAAPTTTTTTAPTTTTAAPTTTTTTAPTTTTAAPTTTSAPSPPAPEPAPPTPAAPPPTVLGAPPVVPALPRTGADTTALVLLGTGLLLLGAAALDARRDAVRGAGAIGHHGGRGGTRR